MDQAILIESNYKKKANRILMKPIVHMARIADSLPPYYTTIRNITVFLREKPIKSEVVAKVSTDSLFKKVFNYGYVYLRKYGYYSFPNMCDCDIWEFINNELVAIGLWENDLKPLYTPNTYKFENDTLWQEVQIHFLPNKKATFLVNSVHKINKEKSNISGKCKLVKKSKLQPKSAVPDTLMKLTYRSLDRKLPLELQFDSHKRLAKILVPEQISQQHACLWVSTGLLKKQSGNPSWEGGEFPEFLNYICENLRIPDSITYVGVIRFNCTIDSTGVLSDIEYPHRNKQRNPNYSIVEDLLSGIIHTVPYWEPMYVDGVPKSVVLRAQIWIDTRYSKSVSTTNPMDKVYPKTDPFTTMNKGSLRDQHKIIMIEYPKETTNTKP